MKCLGEDSPVLFYKEQGDPYDSLKDEDFMLVIMTNFQQNQMLKFAHDKICIDGTHGTNSYDVQLFTLLTVDEFGTGCPVAFCFGNRGDETMLKVFFEAVRSKVGFIKAKAFMSDDAPAFFNAWAAVMPTPEHRLLCSWHVDKCWQKNLSKIKGQEKRSTVYKTLKTLLESTLSLDEFNVLLDQTVTNLLGDVETKNFGEYFVRCYYSRPECWAYCFRKGIGINTNNYLEAFHRNLKHIYLEGKKIKRLDKSIHAVMNIARDSLFKRLIKLTKDTPNEQNFKIKKSHINSESIGPNSFTTVQSGTEWLVKSNTSKCEYLVTKVQETCSQPCLKCSSCQICIHAFKCSCTDNLIKFNICKHIHACCRIFFPSIVTNSQAGFDIDNEVNSLFSLTDTVDKRNVSNNDKLKQKANLILELLNSTEIEPNVGFLLEKKFDSVISLLNSGNSKCIQKTCKPVNTNQKVENQVRFFSTKKKLSLKRIVKKPTINEKKSIIEGLKDTNQVSMHVHTENDHTYNII